MSKRQYHNRVQGLSRFLCYVLGHRPDEFGLVPDGEGFVGYKELLKAVHEEPGWQYVTRGSINEVLMGDDRHLFHAEENRIRAAEIRWELRDDSPCGTLPKVLFAAVRRKAHPVVLEKGLVPVEERYLVLCPDEEMALRVGRRRDREPVLLKIMTPSATRHGVRFFPFGSLFLSASPIPAAHIQAPPLPKEMREEREREEKKEILPRPVDFAPGTFILDPSRDPDPARRAKGKKPRGWKEAARKFRKGKGAIR